MTKRTEYLLAPVSPKRLASEAVGAERGSRSLRVIVREPFIHIGLGISKRCMYSMIKSRGKCSEKISG